MQRLSEGTASVSEESEIQHSLREEYGDQEVIPEPDPKEPPPPH